MARTWIYLALLTAVSSPYLYDRYLVGSDLFSNRPGALQPFNHFKQHEVKFQNRIRNCEDVVLAEAQGLAILSCDPGRDRWNTVMGTFATEKGVPEGGLWLYDYLSANIGDEQALQPLHLRGFKTADFHPLGLDWEADNSMLYVSNHARTGPEILVFSGNLRNGYVDFFMKFKNDLVHAPNSIHSIGNGRLFITNDHHVTAASSPLLAQLETYSGVPGGSVVYADLNSYARTAAKLVARVPFANGVTMLNATTLAVASSSKPGVYFFDVDRQFNLTAKGYMRAPAGVDNLSVDGNGKLLMAGHPFVPALTKVAKQRPGCVPGSEKEEEKSACECGAPSWAAEWSEEGGLKELYKGYEFCSSTTLVRDTKRGVGMMSGLYERGLLVFKE
ncbi:hypothetical protein BDV95DRAFT_630909 [Massariosphaeria phaeospora]|uniref:Calcium-dependent phosphotriesterase n=1 Tax=Massariosphaeria phaeospora TaxID=100035 RepID=A0A7C8I138_9PLEO|nr:hypothetical protein BDV95DRAFT_630909 [Massariosphaeria phaeospora]